FRRRLAVHGPRGPCRTPPQVRRERLRGQRAGVRGEGAVMPTDPKRKLVAEMLGTFVLVFAGTGAIVVNDVHGGAVTHVGIAATFGLVVLAMIYAVGDVSGAHLNPAVTLGF